MTLERRSVSLVEPNHERDLRTLLPNNALLADVALATLETTRQNASRWVDRSEASRVREELPRTMEPSQRIVTKLPLDSLWTVDAELHATHLQDLGAADIRELLGRGPVQFVVADVGEPL